MPDERKTDIYHKPTRRRGYRRITRRTRRLSTRSRYPAPSRGERRISKRELHRRIIFWGLLVALAVVGGYAFYRSRGFAHGPDAHPNPIDFKDPIGR